jgi:hypothetical protein
MTNPNRNASGSLGIGRLLIAVYGILATAATVRALYQLVFKFADAPIAYSLSALSALVYILATVALAKSKSGAKWRSIANVAVWFELVGVLLVGALSLVLPTLFQHASVWSLFGVGYGFVPLVLPILGLIWLGRKGSN